MAKGNLNKSTAKDGAGVQTSAPPLSFLQRAYEEQLAAPLLFSDAEILQKYIGPSDGEGIYSAERLFEQRRDVYEIVVRMLGQDMPIRRIMRTCLVHNRTIEAVAAAEGESIDTLRKGLGARLLKAGRLAVESLEDDITHDRLKPGEKAFAISVLADKGQLLSGGATMRLEPVRTSNVQADLEEFLGSLKRADARETGFAGGEGGALAAGDSAGAVVVEVPLEMGETDSESFSQQGKTGIDTDSDTLIATPPSDQEGGRGSSETTPPPSGTTG